MSTSKSHQASRRRNPTRFQIHWPHPSRTHDDRYTIHHADSSDDDQRGKNGDADIEEPRPFVDGVRWLRYSDDDNAGDDDDDLTGDSVKSCSFCYDDENHPAYVTDVSRYNDVSDDDASTARSRSVSVTEYDGGGRYIRQGTLPVAGRHNIRYSLQDRDNATAQSQPQASSSTRDPARWRSRLREFERDLDEAIVPDSQFIRMFLQDNTRLSREVKNWTGEYSLDNKSLTSLARKLMKGDFRHLYADLPPEDRGTVEDNIARMRNMSFEEILQSIYTYD